MTHLRPIACSVFVALAFLALGPSVSGQSFNDFKPEDLHLQAWMRTKEAEKLIKEEKFLEAFNAYDKAKKFFDTIALDHPAYKPDMIKFRQQNIAQDMASIRDKAREQQAKLAKQTSDLVEGPGVPKPRQDFEVPRLSAADQRKVSELQRQIFRLRSQLEKVKSDRDSEAIRLRGEIARLKSDKNRIAHAPVTGQLKELTDKISRIERERDAMALALRESRVEHRDVLAKLGKANADVAAYKEQTEKLEKMVKVQQNTAKSLVEGLRNQLKDAHAKMAERDKQVAALRVHNEQLKQQLGEAQAEITDLKTERDALLVERDQMAALLKLNESERVRLLIKQNMDLGKDLKQAKELMQEMRASASATADQLLVAQRDFAVAKGRLIEFQRENAAQKERLHTLENRLRRADTDLEIGLKTAEGQDKQEMETLRGIISRQLRVQEARRAAKGALMEEVKRMGLKDNGFEGQLQGLFDQELKLTPKEAELLVDYRIGQDFIFADRPDPRQVAIEGHKLQQNIADMESLARRAFSKKRYFAAREFFESILDMNPGHVPGILNLGVVQTKVEEYQSAIDSFSNAAVLRQDHLPFAHFMQGVCYFSLASDEPSQELQSDYLARSRASLQKALTQEPNNAQTHIFMGTVEGSTGNIDGAEKCFLEAARIDPTISETYYNLSKIAASRNEIKKAWEYYREALDKGADPDLDYESRLNQSSSSE